MKELKDKVTVITGAASGIGRALAHKLARQGARLALLDRDSVGLSETAAGCTAPVLTLCLDVADRSAVDAAAQQVETDLGAADILINNAGVSSSGAIGALTYDTLRWTMDINFWGTVHTTMAFLPQLRSRPAANLVNVSSVYGLIGVPDQAAYCASKFAVRGFTEAVRLDLAETAVAVTLVFPGGVRTKIVRNSRSDSDLPAEIQTIARNVIEDSLRTSPEKAASMILDGLRRDTPRVLIGADARAIDFLARLRPGSYDRVVLKHARSLVDKVKAAVTAAGQKSR